MNKIENNTAEIVAVWIAVEAANGKMLPKPTHEIEEEIRSGKAIVLQNEEGNPIAYCRYLLWNENLIEVGGTVVDPNNRQKGLGTRVNLAVIELAHNLYPQAVIIGLTENDDSKAMIQKMGGVEIPKDSIDPVVWNLCQKLGQECIHYLDGEFPNKCPCTPFVLTDLIIRK